MSQLQSRSRAKPSQEKIKPELKKQYKLKLAKVNPFLKECFAQSLVDSN
jgi:hypothetical protein